MTSSADAIIGETLDGTITDWNPAAERLYGYRATEAIGQPLTILAPPERTGEIDDLLARVGRGESIIELETVRRTKDGQLRAVCLTVSPVRDDTGRIIAASSITRDITERKAAEAERAATHQHTRQVLERITDGFYALDRHWRFTYVNAAAERMLGRTRDELLHQNVWEQFPPAVETPLFAAYHEAFANGSTIAVELFYPPLDGWFDVRVYPSPDGLSVFFRDVTESRHLSQELHASEAKYRTLVEQIPAVVYVLAADENQTPIYFSPRIQELIGELPDEALALKEHWLELVHPDDYARVAAEEARSSVSGEPFRMEYRHRRKDGGYVWVQDECLPIRDDTGQVVAWQGVLLDITERKAAEAALAHERDLLQALMNSSPDAIYFKDKESRFTRVNRAAAQLYGLDDPDAALSKTDFDFYPEEQARGFWNDERKVLEEGIPLVNRLEHQSGEGDASRWTLATKVPLFNQDGSVSGLVGISRDVTDLIRAQEALRRSEARFRSVFTNATDLITILTADGVILYESPPIESMLGYGCDELVGRSAFDLVHPEDQATTQLAFERSIADPALEQAVAFRCLHKDGSWRWLESIGTNLLADPDVGGYVVNSRDISERKHADEELRAALEAAQAANRAKGLFLDMMSHELRSPLQAVLGYSEFLLGGPEGSLTAEQREDIDYIHQGGSRMIALINQLLDLSRMEAGRLELAEEPVDLGEIIEQVRQDVAPQAAAKSLGLQIDLPPSLPSVTGDAERLRQVLLNLVGNAVKFTDQGLVRVTASATTDGIEIVISDTGIGIPAEAMPHIFEEFRQVDSSLTRRHGGAGLGLAIVRKLVGLMEGSISVTSEPNVGSAFTLHLPTHFCSP